MKIKSVKVDPIQDAPNMSSPVIPAPHSAQADLIST